MPITSKNPNWELYDAVLERIESDPTHFNMHEFCVEVTRHEQGTAMIRVLGDPTSRPCDYYAGNDCGTVLCFGGWVLQISFEQQEHFRSFDTFLGHLMMDHTYMVEKHSGQFDFLARELLRLNIDDSGKLFFPNRWPEPFKSTLYAAIAGTPEYARAAIVRFKHFREVGE